MDSSSNEYPTVLESIDATIAAAPKPKPKKPTTAAAVSIENLKTEYLALEARLCESAAEIQWQQGKILLQIKAQLKHGEWYPWIRKYLHIGKSQVALLLKIGALPTLPKSPTDRRFGVKMLARIAEVAGKGKLTPDRAAAVVTKDRPTATTPATRAAARAIKREQSVVGATTASAVATEPQQAALPSSEMSPEQALSIFGIDISARTITLEYLAIFHRALRQNLHPDKGGAPGDFVALDAAYTALGGAL